MGAASPSSASIAVSATATKPLAQRVNISRRDRRKALLVLNVPHLPRISVALQVQSFQIQVECHRLGKRFAFSQGRVGKRTMDHDRSLLGGILGPMARGQENRGRARSDCCGWIVIPVWLAR